eukprot:TRINITY_DN7972_c0_g1_i1.p2 TRINITY_DN7972_c0_g1~~TRINITY_DN7972_c0_g1_i1.p2  ORF type:complete len:328 (-),score=78.59 TRINITY_DN7972_c0_g1_i1:45-947(-)
MSRIVAEATAKKPLAGQVAIITGASRGIGREVALAYAAAGCKVTVSAKSTQEQPNLPGTIYSVAKEVEALGVEALPFQCDVRDVEQIERMVAATVEKWGRVDIMVANAGALWWKDMVDTPMRRYDLINDVNARATFACAKAVLPHMLRQKHGHIITMSPPLDLNMLKGRIGYCISKFGMTLVAHGLGVEVGGSGVACNALWPATMIESFATINFKLGDRSLWRKASILSDCCLLIAQEDPTSFTGHALIDEDYMRSRGITDFSEYRCDPNVEPPRISVLEEAEGPKAFQRGHVTEVKPRL